jgi:hypothetical protein
MAPSRVVSLSLGGVEIEDAGTSCIVLGPTTGTYYVLAYNGSSNPGTSSSVRFAGSVVGPTITTTASLNERARQSSRAPTPVFTSDALARSTRLAAMARMEAKHHMADSAAIASSIARSRSFGMTRMLGIPEGLDLTVGHMSTVRWRTTADCNAYAPISARTVYSGSHIVIVEDTSNPLAGTQDSFLTWLGNEFDSRMYPIEQQNFGDVFARDVAGIGKVLAIMTHRVNDAGVAGFGAVCDFWPRSVDAASNEMPTVTINVPLVGSDSSFWQTYTPGTLMHEVFHDVQTGERLSRTEESIAFETTMVAEGTADYAIMMYFRARCGWTPKTNLAYAEISACENREAAAGHGLAIVSLFLFDIASFLDSIETKSPINEGYWISQLFMQTAIENSGLDEAATIKSYVTDVSVSGVNNFTKHVGRSLDLLVGEYSVGIITDGLPEMASSGRYQLASWNIRDIFAAFKANGWLPRDFPLQPHELEQGTIALTVPSVAAGTTTVLEFQPFNTATATIHITGQNAPLGPNIHLAVVRIR